MASESAQVKHTVEPTARCGKTLACTQEIARGEVIVSEKPLFYLPLRPSGLPAWEQDELALDHARWLFPLLSTLMAAVDQLSEVDRNRFLALSTSYRTNAEILNRLQVADMDVLEGRDVKDLTAHEKDVLGKFLTNTFARPRDGTGIWLIHSRINHSCSPTAFINYDDDTRVMEIRAARRILRGEQITISYISATSPASVRALTLAHTHAVVCQCDVCKQPRSLLERSDRNRQRIDQFENLVGRWERTEGTSGKQVMMEGAALLRPGGIFDEEGLTGGRPRARYGMLMAIVCAAHGQANETQRCALKAVEELIVEGGAETDIEQMRAVALDPSKHTYWAKATDPFDPSAEVDPTLALLTPAQQQQHEEATRGLAERPEIDWDEEMKPAAEDKQASKKAKKNAKRKQQKKKKKAANAATTEQSQTEPAEPADDDTPLASGQVTPVAMPGDIIEEPEKQAPASPVLSKAPAGNTLTAVAHKPVTKADEVASPPATASTDTRSKPSQVKPIKALEVEQIEAILEAINLYDIRTGKKVVEDPKPVASTSSSPMPSRAATIVAQVEASKPDHVAFEDAEETAAVSDPVLAEKEKATTSVEKADTIIDAAEAYEDAEEEGVDTANVKPVLPAKRQAMSSSRKAVAPSRVSTAQLDPTPAPVEAPVTPTIKQERKSTDSSQRTADESPSSSPVPTKQPNPPTSPPTHIRVKVTPTSPRRHKGGRYDASDDDLFHLDSAASGEKEEATFGSFFSANKGNQIKRQQQPASPTKLQMDAETGLPTPPESPPEVRRVVRQDDYTSQQNQAAAASDKTVIFVPSVQVVPPSPARTPAATVVVPVTAQAWRHRLGPVTSAPALATTSEENTETSSASPPVIPGPSSENALVKEPVATAPLVEDKAQPLRASPPAHAAPPTVPVYIAKRQFATKAGDELLKLEKRSATMPTRLKKTVQDNIARARQWGVDMPLETAWTMFYTDASGVERDRYSYNKLSQWTLFTARTVPEFCGSLKALANKLATSTGQPSQHGYGLTSTLKMNTSLAFFREGAEPKWENPYNVGGGRLMWICPSSTLSVSFERLTFLLAGGTLTDLMAPASTTFCSSESGSNGSSKGSVVGVVATRRQAGGDRIEVWLDTAGCLGREWMLRLKEALTNEFGMNDVNLIKFKQHGA